MKSDLRLLGADETAALLPYPQLAEEIGKTLEDVRLGRVHALERATAPLPGDGMFLLMGATDARLAIAKVGSVHPTNLAKGLPTIIASVIVMDATNGRPLALLDGSTVTVRRTAALSLFGARRVGAATGKVLLYGAGAQALGHVEAFHAGLGVGELRVVSRTAGKAHELAERASGLGIAADVIEDAAAAHDYAAGADLIITTTNSRTPVLQSSLAQRLKPGATIVSVGAYRASMAEVPPAVVAACDVVVDSRAGAEEEAGDLIQAAAAGIWSWDGAREFMGVLGGFERSGRPVFVKTVGHSTWDLAAARLAVPVS